MDPTRDNILIRFKAFIDGLGIFTFMAVLLLIIVVGSALIGWYKSADTPEDSAAGVRYQIKSEIEAAQATVLSDEQIAAVVDKVAVSLAESKGVAVETPQQVVPGSPTALAVVVDEPIDPAVMEAGQKLYTFCSACHGPNGEGGPIAPPLAGSEWVTGPVSNLIIIQLRGLKGPIEVAGKVYDFPGGMQPASHQSDQQIAEVLTYIRNSFGNKAPAVKPEEVTALRGEVGKPQATVEELTKP
jgi:mono/diheme cytochrome c family protein